MTHRRKKLSESFPEDTHVYIRADLDKNTVIEVWKNGVVEINVEPSSLRGLSCNMVIIDEVAYL